MNEWGKMYTFELLSNRFWFLWPYFVLYWWRSHLRLIDFLLISVKIRSKSGIDRALCMRARICFHAGNQKCVNLYVFGDWRNKHSKIYFSFSLSRRPPSHSLISSRHQPHPSVIFNHLIKHASNQFHQSKCIKQHDFQFAFVSVLVLNLYRFAIVLSNSISFHSQCDFYWLNIFEAAITMTTATTTLIASLLKFHSLLATL